MKTQNETTIQFSGYPLSVVETKPKTDKPVLAIVKPPDSQDTQKDPMANDPKNWDVDWFNSYE